MLHIASLYVLGQYGCQINSESGSGTKEKKKQICSEKKIKDTIDG